MMGGGGGGGRVMLKSEKAFKCYRFPVRNNQITMLSFVRPVLIMSGNDHHT